MHHVYAKTITRKCPARLSNANRIDGRDVKRVMETILTKTFKKLILNLSCKDI